LGTWTGSRRSGGRETRPECVVVTVGGTKLERRFWRSGGGVGVRRVAGGMAVEVVGGGLVARMPDGDESEEGTVAEVESESGSFTGVVGCPGRLAYHPHVVA
jgi:hypothetical protein